MSDTVGNADPEDEPATEAVSAGGMGRASAILAAGTIVSRVLGFVRAVTLTSAIGIVTAGTPSPSATSCPTTSTPSSPAAC